MLEVREAPPTSSSATRARERPPPVLRDAQLQSLKLQKSSSSSAQAPDRGAPGVNTEILGGFQVHRCLLVSFTTVLGDLETRTLRFDAPVASPSRCARSPSRSLSC